MTNELVEYQYDLATADAHRRAYASDKLVTFCEKFERAMQRLTGGDSNDAAIAALTCWCEGLTPVQFVRKYHMIDGKPTMKADAMLAEFLRLGGDYEVIEKSADRAAVRLVTESGRTGTFELTWDMAQQSRDPWKKWRDKSLGFKDNWATTVDRRRMLWARCVSDAIRTIDPRVNAGAYTTEEMEDVSKEKDSPAKVEKLDPMALVKAAAERSKDEGEVIDAEYVVSSEPEAVSEVSNDEEPDDPEASTLQQRERIRELFTQVGADETVVQNTLAKRGVKAIQELSREQAEGLIQSIETAIRKNS